MLQGAKACFCEEVRQILARFTASRTLVTSEWFEYSVFHFLFTGRGVWESDGGEAHALLSTIAETKR